MFANDILSAGVRLVGLSNRVGQRRRPSVRIAARA
jgi:hypothetical protein